MRTAQLAKEALRKAAKCGMSFATAESCTAGAVALALSKAPGAGDHFHGGFVTYTKEMKHDLLGVSKKLLNEKGAVCREVAEAMAKAVLRRASADVAGAVTGVAGPKPDEDGNPVGLVFCCVASRNRKPLVKRYMFRGPREKIIKRSVEEMLRLLKQACR